jgi:hypothetical protein
LGEQGTNQVVFGLENVTVLQWESGSGVIRINVCHCRLCLVEFVTIFDFTTLFVSRAKVM